MDSASLREKPGDSMNQFRYRIETEWFHEPVQVETRRTYEPVHVNTSLTGTISFIDWEYIAHEDFTCKLIAVDEWCILSSNRRPTGSGTKEELRETHSAQMHKLAKYGAGKFVLNYHLN